MSHEIRTPINAMLEIFVVDDNSMNLAVFTALLKRTKLKNSLDTLEADKAKTLLVEMDKFIYQGSSVIEPPYDIRQNVENFELSVTVEKVEALMHKLN